jgi:prepilin peptidase CpaA
VTFPTPSTISPTSALGIATGVVFVVLLVAGCVTDARERRIPNRLVALIAGVGFAAVVAGVGPMFLGRALAAGALGFAIWIPFYALRMLGAGDVKFFAAAALWLTPGQVVAAAFYTAFVGAGLSVLWLVLEHGARFGLARAVMVWQAPVAAARHARVGGPPRRHIPYGIAMAAGLTAAAWLPHFR